MYGATSFPPSKIAIAPVEARWARAAHPSVHPPIGCILLPPFHEPYIGSRSRAARHVIFKKCNSGTMPRRDDRCCCPWLLDAGQSGAHWAHGEAVFSSANFGFVFSKSSSSGRASPGGGPLGPAAQLPPARILDLHKGHPLTRGQSWTCSCLCFTLFVYAIPHAPLPGALHNNQSIRSI
jgi:hypothetical protein